MKQYISVLNSHKGVFKDLSWMFVAQVLGNLLRFLLIFILIRCYSQEEFGLWASITSIASIIVTGDFGLTNVLRNIASKGLTEGVAGENNIRESWQSAFSFLISIAVIGIIVLWCIKDLSVFESLFKTDNEQLKSLGSWITIVVTGIFLISLPFGMVGGLFLSYGEVKAASLFSIISGVVTFVAVVAMSLIHTRIDIVTVVYFCCPLLMHIISTLFFLKKRGWQLTWMPPRMIFGRVVEMLPLGMSFLVVDFSRNFIPSVLTIYSGAMLGLTVAANINVAQKIYIFFISVMVGLINPIWSRLSRMFYAREYGKCRKMYSTNLYFMIGGSILVILGTTLFRDVLVYIIAGDGYESNLLIFILVGGCLFGKAIYDSAALLLMATNNLKVILYGFIIFCLIAFTVFPEIVRAFGINWMMLTMIVCWTLFIVVIVFYTNSVLKKADRDGQAA